jgi:hypothetical protein
MKEKIKLDSWDIGIIILIIVVITGFIISTLKFGGIL